MYIYVYILYLITSAKIKNIEATEEAKMKLIRDKRNKKDGPSQFVPTNMAVNFVQHNRCKLTFNLILKVKLYFL